MKFERFKKGLISFVMLGALALPMVAIGSTDAMAQGWRRDRWERRHDQRDRWDRRNDRRNRRQWDRGDLNRLRRLDRDRQLRYRYQNNNRSVGYYDRYGRFHAYGYYDRFGRFYRY